MSTERATNVHSEARATPRGLIGCSAVPNGLDLVFFPNSLSELDSVYDRVAEELRSQYSIGYVSSNKRKDGKWRRIVVRIPARENLLIRHRLGYYAPPSV